LNHIIYTKLKEIKPQNNCDIFVVKSDAALKHRRKPRLSGLRKSFLDDVMEKAMHKYIEVKK